MKLRNGLFTGLLFAFTLPFLFAWLGCESDSKSTKSDPASSIEEVVSAWGEVGLDTSKLVSTDERVLEARTCHRGPISGVDVMICRYDTPESALAAREAGLKQIGETTGTALPSGTLLLVVADRTKADPSGKAINSIAKTFRTIAGG